MLPTTKKRHHRNITISIWTVNFSMRHQFPLNAIFSEIFISDSIKEPLRYHSNNNNNKLKWIMFLCWRLLVVQIPSLFVISNNVQMRSVLHVDQHLQPEAWNACSYINWIFLKPKMIITIMINKYQSSSKSSWFFSRMLKAKLIGGHFASNAVAWEAFTSEDQPTGNLKNMKQPPISMFFIFDYDSYFVWMNTFLVIWKLF